MPFSPDVSLLRRVARPSTASNRLDDAMQTRQCSSLTFVACLWHDKAAPQLLQTLMKGVWGLRAGQAAGMGEAEEAGLQEACTAAAYGVEAADVLLRFCQHLASSRPQFLPEQVRCSARPHAPSVVRHIAHNEREVLPCARQTVTCRVCVPCWVSDRCWESTKLSAENVSGRAAPCQCCKVWQQCISSTCDEVPLTRSLLARLRCACLRAV